MPSYWGKYRVSCIILWLGRVSDMVPLLKKKEKYEELYN